MKVILIAIVSGIASGVLSSYLMGNGLRENAMLNEAGIINASTGFSLTDRNGRFRAKLRLSGDDDPILEIIDKQGQVRIGLDLSNDQTFLSVYDENGVSQDL
ncbi:MAG: hypothetical protein MRK02_08025 [Candidatus Scalindua sp.]|nr:hypothetical protein [Candidatus Scalindua sp.]